MKNIFYVFTTFLLAVSCLGGADFSTSVTVNATFDYADQEFGEDSLLFDSQYKIGLGWDYLGFYHKIDEMSSEFKGGFIASYLHTPMSGETSELSNNQYRANVKVEGTLRNKYLVFCETGNMPENHMGFVLNPSSGMNGTCSMRAVFVTNTVAMENALRNSFVAGDQLRLKATGFLSGKKTDEAEIKLAEFTSSKDSVVSNWTYFDLSKLGSIDQVRFDFIIDAENKDIPLNVCMDNVIADIKLESD